MRDFSEWLNARDLYVQYTHTFPLAGLKLIEKYGFLFDDSYFYWIPACKGKKPVYFGIIKRAPLFMYPHKWTPAEKHRGK